MKIGQQTNPKQSQCHAGSNYKITREQGTDQEPVKLDTINSSAASIHTTVLRNDTKTNRGLNRCSEGGRQLETGTDKLLLLLKLLLNSDTNWSADPKCINLKYLLNQYYHYNP